MIDFDLDVNADGLLTGIYDRAANYLPGYEGPTAMVSRGNSFNIPTYTSQRMMLVIDGLGTDTPGLEWVEFKIVQVSYHPGYAQNRTDPSVEGTANDDDYSFKRDGDYTAITIVRSPNADDPNKPSGLPGREFGGKMEAGKTWVNFYCKDYAGASRLRATLHYSDGRPDEMLALSVPLDDDVNGPNNVGDGIADKWEIAMGQRWTAQYGGPALTTQQALAKFSPTDDNEEADPDGAGALVAQAETGDAHTVKEEYRGYVLDGGGLNGAGANGHAGGHIRLDPARKEILVEVDRAAVVNNLPGAGNDVNAKLKTILNGASGVFSQATRGAGIYMY